MTYIDEDQETVFQHEIPKTDNWWERTLNYLEQYKNHSLQFLKVGKVKLDTTNFQRKRNELFRQLGLQVFELMEKKNFDSRIVTPLVDKIKAINEKLSEQYNVLQSMTGKNREERKKASHEKNLDEETQIAELEDE